ncbi:hypothetical protein DY052_07470 [Apilactobacillus timberlakei]|uniref:hypothetical protein n=1 Tax=Apilactobacillus timberlakei TaxID=2008380 RepID=UPI00112CBA8C|nr:hypothetical protein [Apilactobacillus timberlakei]TPR13692.1 hypothetical protein DY052_07470 [Apilactobacillus timberlakei]
METYDELEIERITLKRTEHVEEVYKHLVSYLANQEKDEKEKHSQEIDFVTDFNKFLNNKIFINECDGYVISFVIGMLSNKKVVVKGIDAVYKGGGFYRDFKLETIHFAPEDIDTIKIANETDNFKD